MLHFPKALYVGIIFLCIVPYGQAKSFTQTMHAEVAFETPLKLAVVTMPDFGTVIATEGETYILSTSGRVMASDGTNVSRGNESAGQMMITGASDQTIGITVDNYVSGSGITPSKAMCQYGKMPATSCNDNSLSAAIAPGTVGTSLFLGVQIEAALEAHNKAELPGFDVTIVYN